MAEVISKSIFFCMLVYIFFGWFSHEPSPNTSTAIGILEGHVYQKFSAFPLYTFCSRSENKRLRTRVYSRNISKEQHPLEKPNTLF